jgi:hypothetical protein
MLCECVFDQLEFVAAPDVVLIAERYDLTRA